MFTKKCRQQLNFDSDPKEAWHYIPVTFTPIGKNFMLYCRLIHMLSVLYVRLTIIVKAGIPESFKVGWYPHKITRSSHLNFETKNEDVDFIRAQKSKLRVFNNGFNDFIRTEFWSTCEFFNINLFKVSLKTLNLFLNIKTLINSQQRSNCSSLSFRILWVQLPVRFGAKRTKYVHKTWFLLYGTFHFFVIGWVL